MAWSASAVHFEETSRPQRLPRWSLKSDPEAATSAHVAARETPKPGKTGVVPTMMKFVTLLASVYQL